MNGSTQPAPMPGGMPPAPNQRLQPVPPAQPAPPRRKTLTAPVIVALAIAAAVLVFSLGRAVVDAVNQPDGRVGVIYITGAIGESGGANNPAGLLSQLNAAQNDDDIKAVVLRVDSGGGVAADGEEMANYVKGFSKPVVVSSGASNASAAYYISSQADWIYANKASSVGSIGTILSTTDYSELLGKLGIKVDNITSADNKDAGSGSRPMTQEERDHYQQLVNQINDVFIAAVAEGRDMDVEQVRKIATGFTMTGIEAKEKGLIDEVGTFDDALDKAAALANLSSYSTVSLAPEYTLTDYLSLFMSNPQDAASRHASPIPGAIDEQQPLS